MRNIGKIMEELGGKVVWFPSLIDSRVENEWLMIWMDETFIYVHHLMSTQIREKEIEGIHKFYIFLL